ncbi:hypothetical protein SUGI_0423220 [Cryptomeria japonica]|nr:hypothetical protein SUGI_0423220 [Cryptomeria japonica]
MAPCQGRPVRDHGALGGPWRPGWGPGNSSVTCSKSPQDFLCFDLNFAGSEKTLMFWLVILFAFSGDNIHAIRVAA